MFNMFLLTCFFVLLGAPCTWAAREGTRAEAATEVRWAYNLHSSIKFQHFQLLDEPGWNLPRRGPVDVDGAVLVADGAGVVGATGMAQRQVGVVVTLSGT